MDLLRPPEGADPDYCRSIEAYLCRKNGGHLIRIVGPAFDRVCAWADRGVPLKIAYRGIDRYFERHDAKAPRRRPVRIEFCEADVLDVFDEWRRAVGVLIARERPEDSAAPDTERADGEVEEAGRSRSSLRAHLQRALARLAALRAEGEPIERLDAAIEEIEALLGAGRSLRGPARQTALERLRALDADLVAGARARLDETALQEVQRDAHAELAPFRERMPPDAYARSVEACVDRIVREHARLPVLSFD